ncbi:MAG: aminotransferase class III-fold pyridoxal phosphate-dependent enzyme [Chloroflexi bacterium]|nr:aminotransferase class III-fold pyridoxal phosphate-dependent enzyme [Chloroflexota bacterium]
MPNALDALREEAERRYRERTPKSGEWYERARAAMPGGDTRNSVFFRPYPLVIEGGAGAYLEDVDGHRYLDCTTNMSSVILGHAHPAVVEAVTRQVARGTGWAAANPWAPQLAELLVERIPSVERVRFTNSGTEAVMMAVRAARAATGRAKIAKAQGSYHGSHDDFEVRGGHAAAGIIPSAGDHVVEFVYNDPASVTRVMEEHGDDVAAIIIDPSFMAGGFLPPAEGFLRHLRDEASRHGGLLIFDEVVSLRLSLGGAQQLYGVTPDLTAMGKTIGGGFPVGAFGGRAALMDRYSPLEPDFLHHSGTFNGNPITALAGLTALRQLDADTVAYVNRLGDRLAHGVARVAAERGVGLHVTGVGSLRNLQFARSMPRTMADVGAARRDVGELLRMFLLNEGVLTARGGLFALSTVTREGEIEGVADAIGRGLAWLRPALEAEAPELVAGRAAR